MREDELLSYIRQRSDGALARFAHVVAGPGHDCAVIALPGGECALLKVDQLVEGLHFSPIPATPIELVARKAVARAISDIAAAGGRPLATLVGGIIPQACPWAAELFDQLSAWAAHWEAPLVGGDTAIWRDRRIAGGAPATAGRQERPCGGPPSSPLVLSVTVIGVPHPKRGPVLRSSARPGDHLFVTGMLGGSFDRSSGRGKHLDFEPRLREAAFLCDALGDDLHAMMDVSDGLGRDAARLAGASGVRVELDAALIPLSPGCEVHNAMADGEDYELLFAAPAGAPLPRLVSLNATPITRIGRVVAGTGCILRTLDGQEIDTAAMGYEHGA